MSHIFISYSHRDAPYAHTLAKELELHGLPIWIDDRIDYGAAWPQVIQEKVDACVAFIVIMTSHSFTSSWVQNELNRALRKKKPVFPLLLEGDEPWLSVETVQYVDTRGDTLPPTSFYTLLTEVIQKSTDDRKITLPKEPAQTSFPTTTPYYSQHPPPERFLGGLLILFTVLAIFSFILRYIDPLTHIPHQFQRN